MTYYDLPVVKAAPWKWYVPAYFYAGGVAGAASVLHAATKQPALKWIALAGEAIGGGLLIADLGKPSRFHHMLMAARPTSPMSMGTWILSAAGLTSAIALVKPLPVLQALTGGALATYTGVLVGNTAIPAWRDQRDRLPVMFAASAAASCASLLELAGQPVPRAYAIGAKVADLVASHGMFAKEMLPAKVATAASLVATLAGATRLAGALGTLGGLLTRFAVIRAGRNSAADPRAALGVQPAAACS